MTSTVVPPVAATGSDPRTASPLLELDDVRVHYAPRQSIRGAKAQPVRAVDGVSFVIPKGQTLGLVGGTGSGKSTIAQLIMGMVAPTSGTVRIAGRQASELRGRALMAQRRAVQVVLQDPFSSLDPRMKVGDIIAEPLTLGMPLRGRSKAITTRVAELLTLVGLSPSKASLYPHQFSGGQRQRIAIARALAPRPELIVLDEPTSALDVSVRAQILNLLKDLQQRLGVTYLVISHDLISVAFLAQTVGVMWQGRIVEIGPTHDIYTRPRHPYTHLLHASAPTADGEFIRLLQPATNAATTDLPAGACRFAARCDLRRILGNPERCVEEDPALVELAPAHAAACHFSSLVGATAAPAEVTAGGTPA
jgi:oligopeptide/dipeptide ABC transporter ATP-binding protein